tara:strand:+ start:70 stop:333 length:264 start_codon:yes stop_codon:yes gene_type:complete
MKKVIFSLLLTFSLPVVAHDGPLLSTEHLSDFGLFLIMLSVAFATLSLIMQTNSKSELREQTTSMNSEDSQTRDSFSLNFGVEQSNV